ncbi:unnamed protein product [Amoebophrya sp. A120]|nr:unnamed protein product [Amoebophrya sp. A120]|eukprot:GSA120T00020830001.1
MSINPTLAEDQVTKELFPLPRPGEVFILKRENIFFESASRKARCKALGLFMLSSQRFVFVAQKDKNNEDFGSFEIPMDSILKQEFQQPIFGCNYLELQVTSTDPSITGDTNFPIYLYFYEGGAGTFLQVFFKFFVEVQRRRGEANSQNGLAQVAVQLVNNRHAYVDRSDPSTFYLQQPQTAGAAGENVDRSTATEQEGTDIGHVGGGGPSGSGGEQEVPNTAFPGTTSGAFPGRGHVLGDS